jgi:hypothetical protein
MADRRGTHGLEAGIGVELDAFLETGHFEGYRYRF